jgi:CRP-like cAMP-binding protein
VPFFRDIDQNLLTSIAMILVPEYFNDGDFIIEEGTLGDKMYLIATGKVEIVINGVAKAKLGVGLFFGG